MLREAAVLISNKPLERRRAYAEKLTRLGIPTSPDEGFNSSLVLACYLANSLWRNSAANMGWLGPQSLPSASHPCWRS